MLSEFYYLNLILLLCTIFVKVGSKKVDYEEN